MAENEIIELMKQGNAYLENKEYEKAIDVYTKVIVIDPEYKEAYSNRGIAYYYQGKYEEAIADYTTTIKLDGKFKNAYYNRALAYRCEEKYEEAIADYTTAIKLDDKFKKAYYNRGLAFRWQGKYGEAVADYTAAIELDDEDKNSYNRRGLAYYYQGKYNEAIADYTTVIKLDNNDGGAYNNRGLAYHYQGKYDEAIADYTTAIKLHDTDKILYNNRGVTYEKLKKYDEAIEEYTKALEIDNEFKLAYDNLKNICKTQNGYPDSYYVATVKFYDKKFYDYIEKIEKNDAVKIKIYRLYAAVTGLKNMLIHNDFNEVGHYTKISNLKHLIKPKDNANQKTENEEKKSEKPKEGRLRLNNVSYMNDPTEGEVFIQLLKKYSKKEKQGLINDLYTNKSDNKREVLSGKNHVFLVSFSSAIDTSLPLWVQYSEDGEGCCLVFEESFFDKEDKTSLSCSLDCEVGQTGELLATDIGDKSINIKEKEEPNYCLYKVKYIKGEDEGYELKEKEDQDLSKLIKEIGKQLIGFEDDLKEENKSVVKGIIQNILDQVRFLFKDKTYEHEEEVRLVKFEDNGNVKYTGDAEGFRVPHVYIELEKEMELKEVVLGPKVQNAAEIANYLYYTERVAEVSKSKIKYK